MDDAVNRQAGLHDANFVGAQGVLEDAVDGFVACDSALRVTFLNSAAERLFSKPMRDVLGKRLWEASPDWAESEFEIQSQQVLAERVARAFEWCVRRQAQWLAVRMSPAAWGGLSIWLRDITEQKRTEEKLLENEAVLERHLAEIESIYTDAPVGLAVVDPELRFLRVNRRLAEMNGVPAIEHIGRRLREIVPNLADTVEPLYRRVFDTGVPATDVEIAGTTRAQPGMQRDWLASFYPLRGAGKRIVGVNLVVQEITERKRLERALRERTDELEEAQRLAGVGNWAWDIESDTVTWSDELRHIAGGHPAQPLGGFSARKEYHTAESWRRLEDAAQRALVDGAPFEVEAEVVLPGGGRHWRIIRGEAQRDASGRIARLRGTAQDITARKRAEDELRSAHAELSAIHAHAPVLFLLVDKELRVRKANDAVAQLAGKTEAEMLGLGPGSSIGCLNALRNPGGCGHGPSCGRCSLRLAVLDTIGNGARHQNVEAWVPVRRAGGTEERCFLAFTAPLDLPQGRTALLCALDITDRKRAEEALRESERWLKESQRISRTGSYVFNAATGTWTSSETLNEIFGIGPDYPRTVETWTALVHREQRAEMLDYLSREVLGQRKPFDREYRIVRPSDGQVRWVHGRGVVVLNDAGVAEVMAGTIQDITERRAVEEELRQAHKLEGLGRLAGGIAHDFNNLLTVINGYGDLLLREIDAADPLRTWVSEMRKAGEQAARLTGQLLAFSRRQFIEPQLLDLNHLIRDQMTMLKRLVGEDIEVATQLAASLGNVVADPSQMNQVLLNLVVNARDAMPHGGKLIIGTSNTEVSEDTPGPLADLPAGRYVTLSVADTGSGIPVEAQDQIFDPFFTTKGMGEGTGLGLATVHGIVQQAGGAISFRSEPGEGTTFLICLPRTETASPDQAEAACPPVSLLGSETILVVEDQDLVRRLAVQVLKRQGYRVLEAARGEEALRLAESYAEPIHLLLADVMMPGMTGPDLAARLKALRPSIGVLYMSGYTADVISSRGLLDPGLLHITKPFTPGALAAKTREALLSSQPVG